ncbi:hypothetical protein, partial [Uniformispora flossi]|uniref:hypothetical protein n=1 Tax=Uniformispora flossi TaxID=3390723 RepID=UPI003CFC39B3
MSGGAAVVIRAFRLDGPRAAAEAAGSVVSARAERRRGATTVARGGNPDHAKYAKQSEDTAQLSYP